MSRITPIRLGELNQLICAMRVLLLHQDKSVGCTRGLVDILASAWDVTHLVLLLLLG